MRVIAGYLGGRQFQSPHGHRTHPMSEKMRGALFSMLGDIEGLTVLDPFAGSGALSIEALSRGAASAIALDNDKSAQTTIATNAKELKLANLKLIKANASAWSDQNPQQKFDLILIDPPYDKLPLVLLQKLTIHLADGGTFVLSWPGKLTIPEMTGLQIINQKSYGDSQLVFYQHIR